ncbi:Hypothetical predicted protein [Marmota monax]|uniref:Uncharacterized protein n=1 Tax=Marmota monax TaxID=9995 RepID=A0A5E4A2M6_MARMO|nr:hypothetical protein GHT09_015529 [Marmota monax]VTJ51365.1 Hypothetical predicted protein [Marmota monax]
MAGSPPRSTPVVFEGPCQVQPCLDTRTLASSYRWLMNLSPKQPKSVSPKSTLHFTGVLHHRSKPQHPGPLEPPCRNRCPNRVGERGAVLFGACHVFKLLSLRFSSRNGDSGMSRSK